MRILELGCTTSCRTNTQQIYNKNPRRVVEQVGTNRVERSSSSELNLIIIIIIIITATVSCYGL